MSCARYVSCTVTHPNSGAGEYTWSSIRVGVDQVVISGSDACTTPATYYVGVKSFGNHNSTYTILGWVAHDGHPIELQQGFRQDAVTAANSMTYVVPQRCGVWCACLQRPHMQRGGDCVAAATSN